MCVCALFFLFDKSLLSGAAIMLLMLLFLIFYSPLACYNVYRFVASSLFSCCPIIVYIIFVYSVYILNTEVLCCVLLCCNRGVYIINYIVYIFLC